MVLNVIFRPLRHTQTEILPATNLVPRSYFSHVCELCSGFGWKTPRLSSMLRLCCQTLIKHINFKSIIYCEHVLTGSSRRLYIEWLTIESRISLYNA